MKKSVFYTILLSVFIFMGSIGHGFASDWTLNKSASNVEFFYKFEECNNQRVVLLKITNNNTFDVQVSWKELISDSYSGQSIEGFYGEKQITIRAGQTLQGDCSTSDCMECITLTNSVAPDRPVYIQGLEIKDIKVVASP